MEEKAKRVYIERIVVEDFKSYKGQHTIGPFGRGFNTIVGPNGSGKSNVIDCILFVLGFKAKKLRHTRAEDLIHSGEPRPTRASVSIEMCDGAGGRVAVSRAVMAKGKSVYSINGESVPQERVTELMKEYNVDLVNNRFMILQGEIESISQMKAKGSGESVGLVEYLEEIVGTSVYAEVIKEAEAEVQARREVAERHRAEYHFTEKECLYLQPKADLSRQRIASHIGASIKRRAIIAETAQEIKTLHQSRTDKQHVSHEALEALKKKKEKAQSAESQHAQAHEQAQTEHHDAEQAYLRQKKASEKVSSENRLHEMHRAKSAEQMALQVEEVARLERAKEEGEKRKEEHEKELKENRARMQEDERRKEEIEKKIRKIEGKKGGRVKDALESAQSVLVEQMRKGKVYKDELRKKRGERKEMEKKVEEIEEEIKRIPEEMKRVREDRDAYDKSAHGKYAKQMEEICRIQEETEVEIRKRENVLEALVKEGESSEIDDRLREYLVKIEGYCGRVRDLGTVDRKYAMAVSAVGRGGLHSLVVDTTETAEKCLDVIKKRSLGRHTILVMDRLGEVRDSRDANRLVDKVSCRKEYVKCFYHILGDTLVVGDLDTAMKRAFMRDRPKVVTEGGQVIDKSGLMSSSPVQIVQMAARKTPKETRKEIEKAREAVKEAEEGMQRVEEAVRKAEKKAAAAEAHRKRWEAAESTMKSLEKSLELAKKKRKEMESRNSSGSTKESVDAEEDALVKKVEEMEKIEKEMEQKVKEIEKQMEVEGGAMYREMKATLSGIEEVLFTLNCRNREIEKALLERVASAADISSAQKKAQMTQEKIDEAGKAIDTEKEKEARNAMEAAERTMRESRERVREHEEKRMREIREIDVIRSKEAEIEGEIRETASRMEEMERKEKELEKEAEAIAESLHSIQKRLGKYYTAYETADTDAVNMQIADGSSIISDVDTYILYEEKKEATQKELDVLLEKEEREKEEKERLGMLKEERVNKFLSSIRKINQELKRVYSRLTFGGDAEIEAVDYLDPFSEGVVMSVMPPRKSWKSISQLSGGERTLASLSLIFALHEYHPNSFYVMDEIDAALDYKNVGIVGQFIAERARDCQFLVISLRENMYELADVFIGVYRPAETTLTLAVDTTVNTAV
ncbi:structural maintenance of chromosome 4 [Nematocida minor]|uniref:structural maintenance of chromosome 4 n=1 Tax=Nematocida minor TaxID=1912983 RepID=UPI0022200CBA|nr:structural maintenance of chromosome 4 [Nematocida minor]KAI5191681.1 structural maintenance of chromosome 4 [Nematocida minor]